MIRTTEEFGRLIRKHRQLKGMTQDELAARCGVTRRTVIDLEAGKSGTRLTHALTAAVEVGLCLDLPSSEVSPPIHPDEPDDPLAALPRF